MTYFADVDEVWDALSLAQRDLVAVLRALLTRLDLPFARPGDTATTYDAAGPDIHLKVRHAADGTQVAVLAGPERVAVHWPGGVLGGRAWDQDQAYALEALLTGGNVIRSWMRAGSVVAVDTEVWLPGQLRRVLPSLDAPGARAAVLRRLPRGRRVDATLSFAREPALAPTEPRDRL